MCCTEYQDGSPAGTLSVMEAISYWQLTGLLPYANSNGRYKLSIKYLLLSLMSIVTGTSASLYYQISQNPTFLPIVSYLNLMTAKVLASILPVYNFSLICFVSNGILQVLERLDSVDKTLKRNGFPGGKISFRGRYLFHGTYFLITLMTDLLLFYRQFHRTLPYFVSRMFWTLYVLQILDFIDVFRIYFTRLHRSILKECSLRQLRILVGCHHGVCCGVRDFNRYFSFSLLLAISHIFLYTANILNYIFHLQERYGFKSIKVEIIHFLPMLSVTIILLQLISLCVKTKTAAEEFNNHLYQLMLNDKSREISGDKTLLLHISMGREVFFTAFGFFKVDYTLLHSMIAAATTYFVILVQFGQPATIKLTAKTPPNTTDLPQNITLSE